ncbi:phage holin family protein [Brevibacillus fluminis]|uniref:phage holin family protein n=1 Tax=Brevibacillus fluminis TaxID=511487 RepID=UPI003F88CC04
MFRWIIRLLLNGAALLFISWLFQSIQVTGYGVAVLAAFILGIVNTLIRPILHFFTTPFRWLTLGLFWFVVNAITFALTAYLIEGFEVGPWPDSFITTVLAAALMSLFGWCIEQITSKSE